MHLLKRYFPDYVGPNRRELPRLLAMMGLFFLVVCAVGILRPIKNALALDGLGDTDFYKVYLVSAVVVLFVPVYNKLADRLPWRWLIPIVALSFAVELVLFRVFYVEGSAAFGMMFYGWYDLFAAALVAQFFMATQLFFNARSAKQAYPLVIAGGSLGATLGSAITGFFAHKVGTPNLLLVAAGLIVVFSIALPAVWGKQPPAPSRKKEPKNLSAGELPTLWRSRQVRLIAISVLLTILVKQLVDYQFNTMTKEVFETRDAMAAFQGTFNTITSWLPIVALAALQPALRRWGVGLAVMLLPVAMLGLNVGLAVWFGLLAAVLAKGADTTLRYSTERAAREMLYIPVPAEIKLKAKAYINVAIEKGLGKVLSAVLIFLLLQFMSPRGITFVGVALAIGWVAAALRLKGEYVRTLATSIEGRFANLRGSFASLTEPSARAALKRGLAGTDPLQIAFSLDLVSQAAARDSEEFLPELQGLLTHPAETVRAKALQILTRAPQQLNQSAVRARLGDESAAVREAAVEALCAAGDPETVLGELLQSANANERTAALACLARGVVATDTARWITREYIDQHLPEVRAGDRAKRLEVALAAGTLKGDADVVGLVAELANDSDRAVREAALRSAGRLQAPELYPVLLRALARTDTRAAARSALLAYGNGVAQRLQRELLDNKTPEPVRRQIPAVLANLPSAETAQALLESYLAPETGQVLDYRSLKALGKLRAQDHSLPFNRDVVLTAVRREIAAAERYEQVAAAVLALNATTSGVRLLTRSLGEAWSERQESAFRLLGLLYPPDDVRNCHSAVVGSNATSRANALEWLEQHVGAQLLETLQPVLRERSTAAQRSPTAVQALATLEQDNDGWISQLASWSAQELNGGPRRAEEKGTEMDLIEKVFLLQNVDLLQGARSAHLALLASIAHEQDFNESAVLLKQNEQTDSLYVVIRGTVELRGAQNQTITARENSAFGTWALIDRAPSLVTATCVEPTRVLRIERDDFDDLLSDNPELAIGLLQGVARRVRALVA